MQHILGQYRKIVFFPPKIILYIREWHVWGACADIHAHPLRYDAQSLVAL